MHTLSVTACLACTFIATTSMASELSIVELEPFLVRNAPNQAPFPDESLLGKEWRSRGTVGLAEALESAQPGISLVRKAGMSNDVVVRGLGGDDVSVTLDGRKIFGACSNRMDPPLSHATAESAQSVEIATGPFSLKRSGSLGGHINIVSAEITPGFHGNADVSLGSYSQQQHGFMSSYAEDSWAVRLQGAYLYGDPYETGKGIPMTELPTGLAAYLPEYIDGPAYEAWHAGGEFNWTFSDERKLRLNLLRREDSDVLFPGLKMDADKTETTQLGLRLTDESAGPIFERWAADLYFNETEHLMTDRKRWSSQQGPGNMSRPAFVIQRGYFMQTDATARNWGTTFDGEIATNDWGQWSIGGELGQRQWLSDNIILNIENAMLPDVMSTTAGFYAQGQYSFESPWSLELGMRLDWFHVSPDGDVRMLENRLGSAHDYEAVEPGAFLSARYEWTDHTALFAGLGSVARTPNPQELYIQVDKPMLNPDWLGNPELEAPRATELTAGIEYQKEAWSLRLRVFHSWLDNYIYPVALGTLPADTQSYDNIDARLYGLEGTAHYQLNKQWSLAAGLAWQEGRKEDGIGSGHRALAEIPPLRAQAALQYQTPETMLKLEVQASDNQTRIDPDLNEQDLGAWTTLAFYAERKLNKHWTLACAATNLLDEDYALHNAQVRNPFSAFTVVNEPGRMLKASLRYEF